MQENKASRNLNDRFTAFISRHHLFTQKHRLLVAVSGGVDSVVLCHLCKEAGFDFGIAHCNFTLRGEDSNRDEAFVREWSKQLNVPFHVVKFATQQYSEEQKLSTQVAARNLRYQWFEQVCVEHEYDFILTAHHADDNIETVLMNFFRGTGINGLTGIQPVHQQVRRPLLFAKRHELESYLKWHGLSFVQDESNLHDDYTRNYFRNTVLPLVAKTYPEVQDNLLDNIGRFNDVAILYRQEIKRLSKKLLITRGEQIHLPVLLLQKTPAMKTVLLELIKPYGFKATQLNEVIQLLGSESGRYTLAPSHRILKDRKHLIISPLENVADTAVVIEKGTGTWEFAKGAITLTKTSVATPGKEVHVALLDEALIQYPLLLRPWRAGDYFYPLGMKGKKKLAKFFVDQKLSLADKEKVWVLEMNRKIVWVVGYRIDDRFKMTDKTKSVLKIEWRSQSKKPMD
ncbi:tRNA lysidine(34) synthetase TilS [Niabella yanshanensis]|uniref:tRNA(Ile)-lysidine synthase n=1 Tax=Niabella yanshanensis TaxID=577386 RepID=A0ABZ0WBY5_9BACT|nr:tRNA lysidine(34) synthetase TilS [Niabella yanshanensis]WQD39580.1 tRNA lysidine(34) synthetase TilS [Niabella yanshanensis]